jgi:hypothetical protein
MPGRLGKITASVLLSLVCGAALADPQAVDEAQPSAITAFVSNITRWDGERIARWRIPVCPSVSGATAEQAGFIRSRVLEVAAAAHAPASGDKQCEANLFIFLTEQPEQLWTAWRDRYPKMFARESRQSIKRIVDVTRPVVTWQNAALNATGMPSSALGADRLPEYRLSDSRFRSSVSEDFLSVIVVVNASATGQATFGQLADYIAMVSLARVDLRLDPNSDLADAPTILKVFARDFAGAPKKLTNWDAAFLKGLYQGSDPLMRKRAEIVSTMRAELAR